MHGGEHAAFRPGRGFVAPMSEPETAPADDQPEEDVRATLHNSLTADYQRRLSEHNIAVAKSGRSEQRRTDWDWAQRSQRLSGGQYGFKRFYRGRTELTGTPAYGNDWRQITRPQVQENLGPGNDRVANIVERQTKQKALANRSTELEAEGSLLGMLGQPDTAASEPSTAPSTLSGESVPFPRSGALQPGSQFQGINFSNLVGQPDDLPR